MRPCWHISIAYIFKKMQVKTRNAVLDGDMILLQQHEQILQRQTLTLDTEDSIQAPSAAGVHDMNFANALIAIAKDNYPGSVTYWILSLIIVVLLADQQRFLSGLRLLARSLCWDWE